MEFWRTTLTTSSPRKGSSAKGGFTLVEVVMALALAGGALILVLGANRASLRRCTEARAEARLESRIETKLEEISLGLELGVRGELPGMPGWRWESVRSGSRVAGLKHLKLTTLSVFRPDGGKGMERRVITYAGEKSR